MGDYLQNSLGLVFSEGSRFPLMEKEKKKKEEKKKKSAKQKKVLTLLIPH